MIYVLATGRETRINIELRLNRENFFIVDIDMGKKRGFDLSVVVLAT